MPQAHPEETKGRGETGMKNVWRRKKPLDKVCRRRQYALRAGFCLPLRTTRFSYPQPD
jgi:hypothetical protein